MKRKVTGFLTRQIFGSIKVDTRHPGVCNLIMPSKSRYLTNGGHRCIFDRRV